MRGIDQLPALGGIRFRQKNLFGDFAELGIAIITIAIGEGQFHGFDDGVQILGAVVAHTLQIEPFEDVERLEHDRSLGPEAGLVNRIAAIGRGPGLVRFGLGLCEIGVGDQTAVRFGEGRDPLGESTLVEVIMHRSYFRGAITASLLLRRDHLAQRARQVRHVDYFARFRNGAVREKEFLRSRPQRKHLCALLQVLREDFRDRE